MVKKKVILKNIIKKKTKIKKKDNNIHLVNFNKKIDKILENEKKILLGQKKILKGEEELEELERKDLEGDKKIQQLETKNFSEIERLKEKIITTKALVKITKKDILKGFIGAIFGVMGHFAFSKGFTIAKELNHFQIAVLYISTMIFLVLLLYYSGFREVHKKIVLKFIPKRAIILYMVSILAIIVVNLFYSKIGLSNIGDLYAVIGVNLPLAVIGAGSADLIGKNE